jgi:hypothetical protein
MSKAAELAALIGSQTALSNRNMVINGAMNVAQRSTSVADVGGSSGYFTCDRWRVDTGNTAGRVTMSQASVTDLAGFANALKLDVTTSDTSIASGEVFRVGQRIEGQNLQQIAKGTASAKALTLSFYVKGNAAATYVAQLKDADNTRANTQNFSVTTSWTRVKLTYVADTTGTLGDDNANSLEVMFWLHGGSDFTSGTFASNTWASETNANNYAGSNTSIFDSTDRELFITGVQLEVGETATPFEHEDFGTTLAKCQRYYNKSYAYATAVGTASTYTGSFLGTRGSGIFNCNIIFPTSMRTAPTVTIYSPETGTSGKCRNVQTDGDENSASFQISEDKAGFNGVTSTVGHGLQAHYVAEAEL